MSTEQSDSWFSLRGPQPIKPNRNQRAKKRHSTLDWEFGAEKKGDRRDESPSLPPRPIAGPTSELPDAKRKRFEGLGIGAYNASVLTAEVETARWFDTLLDEGAPPPQAANWVSSELFGALNRMGKTLADSPVSPAAAAELLKLVADGTISGSLAKQVFEIMLETGDAPGKIVEERGLKQTSDTGEIDARIDEILAANADKVLQYKDGKEALFGFFVGQTMKAMAGKANPGVVNERLRAKLAS